MDTSFTYSSKNLIRVMIYAPPGLTPPASIPMATDDGKSINVLRISDLSLECEQCKSRDCHRLELHKCQCGRHAAPRFEKAAS